MTAEIITKIKWFWAWQDEKEEAWLSEMASDGYHLAEVNFPARYRFQAGEPANMIYRLDYQAFQADDKDSYLQIFADAGWECVGEMAGWVYFRTRADEGQAPEIFSDLESKKGKYHRLLLYLSVFLPILVVLMPSVSERYGVLGAVLEGLSAILILLYTLAMVQIFRRINRLNKDI